MRQYIKQLIFTVIFIVVAIGGSLAQAASKTEKSVMKALQENLTKVRPGLQVIEVKKSDLGDLYEAELGNGDVLYSTKDGVHIFSGKLLRIEGNRFVDVRDEQLKPLRAKTLKSVSAKETINFSPEEGKPKAVIRVFTDVDCGYCQKLHANMEVFNKMGVEVRYLAFPRAGVNSVSAKKLVNAWCSDDPNEAMNKLKTRQKVEDADCNNPVAEQYAMGQRLGVTGTPAIYKEDGENIGGYLSPVQLAQALGILAPPAPSVPPATIKH